ncbi:hypothetical protein LC087_12500 [Bacillus carboniphilus]|uniref:Uncharacterized protein n=1 Tax=Bacillus carboniphilus TaxID=86663 RepID=A0ABY9JS97_9BACI|nr:hypothetical protein [Bacillus carboniphilus]WLR41684.1 hypothetical protein LC087_12500 [Bacillus carboniphilus]
METLINDLPTIWMQLKKQFLFFLVVLSTIYSIILLASIGKPDERQVKIMMRGYYYPYTFIFSSIFFLFIMNCLKELSYQSFRDGILIIICLSNMFLASSVFILNKKI